VNKIILFTLVGQRVDRFTFTINPATEKTLFRCNTIAATHITAFANWRSLGNVRCRNELKRMCGRGETTDMRPSW